MDNDIPSGLDARYSIRQEFDGHPHAMWVVRFCGDYIDSKEKYNQALSLARNHARKRMRNFQSNKDPDTGIAYGYIAADKLHPEQVEQLQFGSKVRDISYEEAKADYLAEAQRAYAALAELTTEELEFNEEGFVEKFADQYTCEEPVFKGELDGVHYQSSWLGGALNFFIFKSMNIVNALQCSPCVPGAGDLNNVVEDGNGMPTYGVPADWLDDRKGEGA